MRKSSRGQEWARPPKLPWGKDTTSSFDASQQFNTTRNATILELDRANNARRNKSLKDGILEPLSGYHCNPNNTDVSFLMDDPGHRRQISAEDADNTYDFLLPVSLIPVLKSATNQEGDPRAIGDMGQPQSWMHRAFPGSKPSGRMGAVVLDKWLTDMLERVKEEYVGSVGRVSPCSLYVLCLFRSSTIASVCLMLAWHQNVCLNRDHHS